MIEKILYDYLSLKVSTPVKTEKPKENIPEQYYLIEKTGGSQTNHIKRATVAIQSYANSLYEASSLNEVIKEIMLYEAIELDSVASITLDSDYNFTDTTTKQYRYQAVFNIVHY